MEERAGEEAGTPKTVEELLQKSRGWSKFDPFASDVERLVEGGVRHRDIIEWLAAKGVKASSGEISTWMTRRRNQRTRRQQVAARLPAETPTQYRLPLSVPAAQAPSRELPASADALPQATVPAENRPMHRPDERSSAKSQEELDLEAQIAAAQEAARRSRRQSKRNANKDQG